jgi:hypothetical protein
MGDPALVGSWKMLSCFMEDILTGERSAIWGEHPNGYIVLTANARWIVVQTAEGRTAPHTDEDRAAAFQDCLICGRKPSERIICVLPSIRRWGAR